MSARDKATFAASGPAAWQATARPVYRGGGGSGPSLFVGILDQLSTPAVGAWSVSRALHLDRIGQGLVDLRRSSDNGTTTIAAGSDGDADLSAYEAWAGADTVYCSKVYDQSGNGKHLLMGTAGSQPKFTKAGGLNGLPAIFDDSTRAATMAMAQGAPVNDMWATGGSAFVAMKAAFTSSSVSDKGNIRVMQSGNADSGKIRPGFTYGWSTSGFGSAFWVVNATGPVNQGAAFVWGVEYSAAADSNAPNGYINGSVSPMTANRVASGTAQADTSNVNIFSFGADDMYLGEQIYFATLLSSGDRGTLQNDMVARYVP